MKSNNESNPGGQHALLAILLAAAAGLLFAAAAVFKMSPYMLAWCAAAALVCHVYSRLTAMSSPAAPSVHCFAENSASSIAALAIAFFPGSAIIFVPILVLTMILFRLFTSYYLSLNPRELLYAGLTASVLFVIFLMYMVFVARIGSDPLKLSLLGYNSIGPLPLWAIPAILVPAVTLYALGLIARPELRLLSCGRHHFERAGFPYSRVSAVTHTLLGLLSAFAFALAGWAACLGTFLPKRVSAGFIGEILSLLMCLIPVSMTAMLSSLVHPLILIACIPALSAVLNIFQLIKESPLHD